MERVSRPRRNARPQVSPIAFPRQSRPDPAGWGTRARRKDELPHVFSDVTAHCMEAHGAWRAPDPAETHDRRSPPSRSFCNRGPIRAGSGDPPRAR